MSTTGTPRERSYRYLDFLMAAYVTVLLCANVIGPTKLTTAFGMTFNAANLFFPISYLFNDILTEVYGFAKSRRVVWAGFVALFFAAFMSFVIVKLPSAEGFQNQAAVETIFGSTWRIVASSLLAYFIGEFANSFVLAKMKIWTKGKALWARLVTSTMAGEAVDTLVFYPLAFYGVWSNELLLAVMFSNYLLKVGWEVLATPMTYRIIGYLKKRESEDYFDYKTDFSPFKLD